MSDPAPEAPPRGRFPLRRALLALVLIPLALWSNRRSLGLVPNPPPTVPEVAEISQELARLLEEKHTPEALALLQELARPTPSDPHLTALLMDGFSQLGRGQEAVAYGERALNESPDLHGIRLRLGRALADLNRWEDAERQFLQILSALPRSYRARVELGRVFHHRGNLHQAAEHYRQALAIRENFLEGQVLLGTVLAEGLDLVGAQAAFRRSLELDPDNSTAQTNLGMVCLRKGEKAEARKLFEAVLARDPGEERASRGLRQLQAEERPAF